jgi:hypothetical protein
MKYSLCHLSIIYINLDIVDIDEIQSIQNTKLDMKTDKCY